VGKALPSSRRRKKNPQPKLRVFIT